MVFAHFLKNGSNDLAQTTYLDSLDHYLQLSNWLHVPKNFGSRAIIWRRSKIDVLASQKRMCRRIGLKLHTNVVLNKAYNFLIGRMSRERPVSEI